MSDLNIIVIGTAGRIDRGAKPGLTVSLTKTRYQAMTLHWFNVLKQLRAERSNKQLRLISGGAPWADHLAVLAFNAGLAEKLHLCFPSEFNPELREPFVPDASIKFNPGKRLNHLHALFSEVIERNSLLDILFAVRAPHCTTSVHKGFFPRNDAVASQSEGGRLFAYSFGEQGTYGPSHSAYSNPTVTGIPSGGTAYTWSKANVETKTSISIQQFPE